VESAVLLVPFAGADRPSYPAQFRRSGAARVLKLATPNGATDYIAWTPRLDSPIELEGEIVTDSPFAWLRTDGSGKLAASYLLGGTYLECEGHMVFDRSKG
jgi:hypothetical protein